MSIINFMFSWVEHGKNLYFLGHWLIQWALGILLYIQLFQEVTGYTFTLRCTLVQFPNIVFTVQTLIRHFNLIFTVYQRICCRSEWKRLSWIASHRIVHKCVNRKRVDKIKVSAYGALFPPKMCQLHCSKFHKHQYLLRPQCLTSPSGSGPAER